MGVQIPIAQAEADFASLIERVERGEEIVVTRDGRPVVRLSREPGNDAEPLVFGDLKGQVETVGGLDLPEEEIEAFYQDLGRKPR